jgi:hypothetical protein
MKHKKIAIIFILLVGIVMSITSCTNSTRRKQANEEMNLAGFIFKVPVGFSVGKTASNYREEQATTWSSDSIVFNFDVWKKGYGISSPEDLYNDCQYMAMRGGSGFIENDNPTKTDNTIFALGKELGGNELYTSFRMILDYPNSPNLILIESYFKDRDLFRINEIIQNNLKNYIYNGVFEKNISLNDFFKTNVGNYDLIENELIKQRICKFAGDKIYHLICAHIEKVTPIEQKNYNGNAFYKWFAFDNQAMITILYNVATDHLQILIEEDEGIQFYSEGSNEYSPFKDKQYYNFSN